MLLAITNVSIASWSLPGHALGTEAAIKVLKGEFTAKELVQFRAEAQTIARLEHPHIVRIITFSVAKTDTQDIPFLAMSYAAHGTLDKRYPRGSKLPCSTIVTYVKQIAEALQYAHDHKIIHRDVKPANFLVGNNDEILLSDFGIAVIAHRTVSWVEQNVAGSKVYMAPEQFLAEACPASDQYALGITVYQWLSGELPFTTGEPGYLHEPVPFISRSQRPGKSRVVLLIGLALLLMIGSVSLLYPTVARWLTSASTPPTAITTAHRTALATHRSTATITPPPPPHYIL